MSRLLTSIYYKVKPFLPWRFRMALRQWRAKRRRKAFAAVWPINPAAGAAPPGWPGWPRGAQFSLVLTHDVEGQKGYARVPLLMEVEQNMDSVARSTLFRRENTRLIATCSIF